MHRVTRVQGECCHGRGRARRRRTGDRPGDPGCARQFRGSRLGGFPGRLPRPVTVAAEREHRDFPALRQEHDSPEDLLDLYLAERVFPPERARSMLGPSARGERPLWPRLSAGFGNYCVDLARAARSRSRERPGQVALESAQARASVEPVDGEDLRQALREMLEAIRTHVPPGKGGRAPHREALFLRLRLDWLGGFAGAMVRWFNGEKTAPFDSALLEELTAWNEREAAAVLGECGLTLAQAWQQLRPLLEATPGARSRPARSPPAWASRVTTGTPG